MKINGGEILGKTLKAAGVEKVFGLVGHGNIGLIDGIVKEGIEFISCHHETVAGMAADGYFRASGKPGVVCLTCSPGALNAQVAIATAAQDHSAVVYIVGDIPMEFAGKGTYEELDLNGPDDQFHVLKPNFKRAWKVTNLNLLSQYIANAFNAAVSGCPGPVLLNIPFDLDAKETETVIFDVPRHMAHGRPRPDDEQILQALDLLLKSKEPVLLVGGGIGLSNASHEVLKLSELLGIPIVSSIMGAAFLPGHYPGFAGFIGSYGTSLANELVRRADLVLAVGTRFEEEETAIWLDGQVFQIPPTKIIQIDIDPLIIGRNYPVAIGMVGDAAMTLGKMIHFLSQRNSGKAFNGQRIQALASVKKEWFDQLLPAMTSKAKPINPRRVLKAMTDKMPQDTVLTLDPSWTRIGLLQQLGMPGAGRCYIAGGIMPIGWSTSSALGVAAARKPARVVAVSGDGGFLMGIQSLLTAVEYDLPITWVIIDNGGYNALDVLQKAYFGGRSVGSLFEKADNHQDVRPDLAAVARGFRIQSERIENPEDIEPAIERSFASTGPYVLDFIADPDESRLVRTAAVTWTHFWSHLRDKKISQHVG